MIIKITVTYAHISIDKVIYNYNMHTSMSIFRDVWIDKSIFIGKSL